MVKALGDCRNHSTNKGVVSSGEQKKTGMPSASALYLLEFLQYPRDMLFAFPYLFPWGTERLRPENLLLHERHLLVQTTCSREGPPQQRLLRREQRAIAWASVTLPRKSGMFRHSFVMGRAVKSESMHQSMIVGCFLVSRQWDS